MSCPQENTCPVQLQENFVRDSLKAIEKMKQDKEFQTFLKNSFQQRETVLEEREFQESIADLQVQDPLQASHFKHTSNNKVQSENLYIFVSFSLGEKALLNLAQEAKIYGATLVLRGFKDGSYAQTVKSLQKIIQETGQSFMIDPELFTLFGINVVPTYVLSKPFKLSSQERMQTPLYDRLQGHVSVSYALGAFAKEGSLKENASSLLANAILERGIPK
ncbi:MAG: type-F conjugative transfer system pilin assembly protein TrbC [Alphaproteobacteria bacterium]|nr:type-F conjugative transfer system pilin assembly protein TrbC [Alphaproteobacteria bacterium]